MLNEKSFLKIEKLKIKKKTYYIQKYLR